MGTAWAGSEFLKLGVTSESLWNRDIVISLLRVLSDKEAFFMGVGRRLVAMVCVRLPDGGFWWRGRLDKQQMLDSTGLRLVKW